jgi:hypothetical protein
MRKHVWNKARGWLVCVVVFEIKNTKEGKVFNILLQSSSTDSRDKSSPTLSDVASLSDPREKVCAIYVEFCPTPLFSYVCMCKCVSAPQASETNERLYRNYLPLHHASGSILQIGAWLTDATYQWLFPFALFGDWYKRSWNFWCLCYIQYPILLYKVWYSHCASV